MKEYQTQRSVAHSAEDMFDLVADVESYPQFLPLCADLKITERRNEGDQEILIADMTVSYQVIQDTFKSKVTLNRKDREIIVDYLDGPFRTLHNRWKFDETGENSCMVDFFIAYELRSKALQILAGAVFDKALKKLSNAFEDRADQVYGGSSKVS